MVKLKSTSVIGCLAASVTMLPDVTFAVQENKADEQALVETARFGDLTYSTDSLTVNLAPIIVIFFLLYFVRVFSLLGTDVFGDLTGGGSAGYGAPPATYNAPAPSYNAPAANPATPSYNAPSTGYNNGGNRIDAMTAALLFGTANPFFGNQGASGYGAPGGDTPSQPAQPVLPEGNGNGVDDGLTLTNEELQLYQQLLLGNNLFLERGRKRRRR